MDFIVLSHLRWDFVYQRPQHLLSRCARTHRVWFWEEPKYLDGVVPRLNLSQRDQNLQVLCPELPNGLSETESFQAQRQLLDSFLNERAIREYVLWYYTPMARNFTRQLMPSATVYDCMDELSAFRGAPPGLRAAEADLFASADLVFTGGRSLYEAKRTRHPSVHCFPSSIDAAHFAKARHTIAEPSDQACIPLPRIGYCGVIDERMDLELLARVAENHPNWHLIMVGPVVKISDADLPRAANIHYLGGKDYTALPLYMAGWDVGMLPFARNESTRFISPTKTPEYLAAGLPVVSTSITDVVRPYAQQGLVQIADSAEQFAAAIERCLRPETTEETQDRLRTVDEFLSHSSWDKTWSEMESLILTVVSEKPLATDKLDGDRLELSSTAD
jgi:glycosyltransferase involved in cell wall biosynthesis